jgi:hypothetical protein
MSRRYANRLRPWPGLVCTSTGPIVASTRPDALSGAASLLFHVERVQHGDGLFPASAMTASGTFAPCKPTGPFVSFEGYFCAGCCQTGRS